MVIGHVGWWVMSNSKRQSQSSNQEPVHRVRSNDLKIAVCSCRSMLISFAMNRILIISREVQCLQRDPIALWYAAILKKPISVTALLVSLSPVTRGGTSALSPNTYNNTKVECTQNKRPINIETSGHRQDIALHRYCDRFSIATRHTRI